MDSCWWWRGPRSTGSPEWTGVEAGTSLVFSLAILFLIVVSIYLSMHITALEEKVELLAEEVALLRGVQPPESGEAEAELAE